MIIYRLVTLLFSVYALTREENYKATNNLYNMLTEISSDALKQGKLLDYAKMANNSKMKEEKVEELPTRRNLR